MIKNYIEWLNEGYNDPPEEETPFVEMYDEVIATFEKKLAKEGVKINPDTFWKIIQDLDKEDEFQKDLENFANKWFDKMYYGNYDPTYGERKATKEYKKIEAKVKELENDARIKGQKFDHRTANSYREDLLMSNLIEKHWDEYKKIYQKWIDLIHSKRGQIMGKNYGL